MSEYNRKILLEKEKARHHPWEIWITKRKNYRARGPAPFYKERSFKTYVEAKEWLDKIKNKETDLHKLKVQGITPRGEIRKVIGFIRQALMDEEEEDYKKIARQTMLALSKIHQKMA